MVEPNGVSPKSTDLAAVSQPALRVLLDLSHGLPARPLGHRAPSRRRDPLQLEAELELNGTPVSRPTLARAFKDPATARAVEAVRISHAPPDEPAPPVAPTVAADDNALPAVQPTSTRKYVGGRVDAQAMRRLNGLADNPLLERPPGWASQLARTAFSTGLVRLERGSERRYAGPNDSARLSNGFRVAP
jgi:hypothetical protein